MRVCHDIDCKKVLVSRSDFLVCSKCKYIHYCSRKCQKSDWKYHKTICFDAENITFKDHVCISTTECRIRNIHHKHGKLSTKTPNLKKTANDIMWALKIMYKSNTCGCGVSVQTNKKHATITSIGCKVLDNDAISIIVNVTCDIKCTEPRTMMLSPVSKNTKYIMVAHDGNDTTCKFLIRMTTSGIPLYPNNNNGKLLICKDPNSIYATVEYGAYRYDEESNSWIIKK